MWKTSPDVAEGRFKDIIGALVLHGDQLLVSRYDGLAAALTVKDSLPQVVWKHRLPAIGTSTYRDGRIYYGTLNGEVHAMNALTGKMVWMTETGQSVAHLTATERGLVVVGTNGRVIYLSSDAGKMQWHDDVGGMVSTEPMASQQEVYILTGNKAIYGMRLEH